ncbi:hypothetical protein RchiOBHm_Chr5g0029091 [Rosa chinensis]|uniref:Uncharacterized protein n=1 Tax=Rosa chinensis TaxID=74649 RepID=A0A2P6Q9J7_ROSCH|nr:hypothetical protein RchiOBHm_Chr5g0029091 [Rosa chinensis]
MIVGILFLATSSHGWSDLHRLAFSVHQRNWNSILMGGQESELIYPRVT